MDRLAIIGPARSGKDYVRQWLHDHTAHVATCCTSWFAAEHVWRHWQMDHHNFGGGNGKIQSCGSPFCIVTPTKEILRQFWEDRKSPERREYWAACMAAYNWSDRSGCRLYREMVENGQTLLVGIRRLNELWACIREGIVDNVVCVEGGVQDDTCEITWHRLFEMPSLPNAAWRLDNTKQDPDDIDAKLRSMCETNGIEVFG